MATGMPGATGFQANAITPGANPLTGGNPIGGMGGFGNTMG